MHSDQCWCRNAITPPPLPAAQFTHQSNRPNPTACTLSRTASWLVLQRRMLTALDLHQSRVTCRHSDRPARPPKWCSRYCRYVYTRVVRLQRFISRWGWAGPWMTAKDCGNCLWSHLWVVCHWRCLLRRHNCRRSVRHLFVADLPQLDQLSWRTSRQLTRRRHCGGDVHNFSVWIISNCCPNYCKRKT